MKITLSLLICIANTMTGLSQSKIYYNQDCEITIPELSAFYSVAKVDTTNRIFTGKVFDYSSDGILIGELEYDQEGKKNGPIKRFRSSGEIKLEGLYKNNKRKGDWSLGKMDLEVSGFVKKSRLEFQIDSLEGCLIKKEEFIISKFIRRNDYPEIRSILISEKERNAYRPDRNGLLVVDQRAEFPDGMVALKQFIMGFMEYPKEAAKNKIKGNVNVEFIINSDGSTTDFKVAKGLGYGCDEEAIRVSKLLPDWSPAYKGGRAVKSRGRIVVTF